GGFLVAELIDQLEIDRLTAGKHPPVRDFFEQRIVQAAALFDEPAEPGKGSFTSASSAARASGLVGSKPLGAAFSGEDFTSSTLTPTVFINSVKFGYWNRTPIEPTSELCWATMWSAAIAVM